MAKNKGFDYKTLFFGMPVILTGIIATLFLSYYIYSTDKHENRLRFEYETRDIIKRLQFQMLRYEDVLVQTRAFLLSSENVTKLEFNRYFEKLALLKKYPGIRGLGLTLRIPSSELKNHLAKMRATMPGYKIWPDYKRDEYFSLIYLNPLDEDNMKAIGYDMFTDPVRKETMLKAWYTGEPQLSRRLVLVQERGKQEQPGLNFYIPIYKDGASTNTLDQRKEALIGFIYSPFRAYELFNSILFQIKPGIEVEIYDDHKISHESALYDHDGQASFTKGRSSSQMESVKRLSLYGQDFTIKFITTSQFKMKSIYLAPFFVFVTGTLITLLISYIFTIMKRQARESQESEMALGEALQSRDEFISIASHELKTPLTSIKLQTQMMKRSFHKCEDEQLIHKKVGTFLEKTETQTLRLERLIDDMLDISRIRSGKLTIEKEELNLNQLIQDVVSHMKEQFKNIPGGTPKLFLAKNTHGIWDKMRIEQVITNLLTNAIKYGDSKDIEISTEATETHVSFSVKDYGIGISLEYQEKIFNRFERAGISATEISGLGIGLYITQQIVKSHGGTIHVRSLPQSGSTFTVTLPKTSVDSRI